jgi:signal transduction histidine kinase
VLAALFVAQWRATRQHPVRRAQLKWFGLLLLLALTLAFVASLFATTGRISTHIRMAYGFMPMSLIFLGLVPLITRLKLFELEAWWPRAWLWFLGGLLVVALDVVLLAGFPWLAPQTALTLALALAGWGYFPLRQWIWLRLAGSPLARTEEVLPHIVALTAQAAQVHRDDASMQRQWVHLWERLFQPGSCIAAPDLALEEPLIDQSGARMLIPAPAPLQPLALRLPNRGTRLFTTADVRRARDIGVLVGQGLATSEAHAQGGREERQRIAADLHDDLGATLLSLAHSTDMPRMSLLARKALDDMRLSVKGLTQSPTTLAHAVSDWRADVVSRLAQAHIRTDWQQGGLPEQVLLAPRTQMQLTRIVREGVSNIIHHSGANACRIDLHCWNGHTLVLALHDNGRGMPSAEQALAAHRPHGHGLPNIERRARSLGGTAQWLPSPLGGAQ